MATLRGFSDGYGRGLYQNESEVTSKDCLGERTYKNIMEFNRFLTSGDFINLFKSVGKFYQIGFDIQKECRFNEFNFEVTGYCLNKTNDCRPNTLVANLQSNLFKITGEVNSIMAVYFEFYGNFGKEDVTKVDDATFQYTQLGRSVGKVIRTITGFSKTHSDGGRRKRPVTPSPKAILLGDNNFEFDLDE
jgi:hypothetical protein